RKVYDRRAYSHAAYRRRVAADGKANQPWEEHRMRKLTRRAFHAITLAAATCLAGMAHAQQIDLAGRTVTLIHNVAPGGATALTAQLAADAWARTMAGNPTIIVQSVEGGALSRGIHQVMNSRPDGLTVGWLAWDGSTRVLDPAELQIPFD